MIHSFDILFLTPFLLLTVIYASRVPFIVPLLFSTIASVGNNVSHHSIFSLEQFYILCFGLVSLTFIEPD